MLGVHVNCLCWHYQLLQWSGSESLRAGLYQAMLTIVIQHQIHQLMQRIDPDYTCTL